jgi:hypothetical protein
MICRAVILLVLLLTSFNHPAGAGVLTDFADGAWAQVTTALGHPPGPASTSMPAIPDEMRAGPAPLPSGAPPPGYTVPAGLSDNQVRDAILRDHLASYAASGRCMCPEQRDPAGQPCGRRAGYGSRNSNIAVCYTSQIDQRMIWEWRTAHPGGR